MITVRDIDIDGKTVLHHCDFNIKLVTDQVSGKLAPVSDVRIKANFPSIFYLINRGCKVVLMSYLERPQGQVVEQYRLKPVAERLSQLINRNVVALNDCVGPRVRAHIEAMQPGELCMLENTRFHPGEQADDDVFAKELASLGVVFVQDAFGHCHRTHASVTGIPRHVESVAGLYLAQERRMFDALMSKPTSPVVLIVGGTKTHDKILAIEHLIEHVDTVLVGGAAAHWFLAAQGIPLGGSFMEEPYVGRDGQAVDLKAMAGRLMESYGDKLVLPCDMIAADSITEPQEMLTVSLDTDTIPDGWAFLDIGPDTMEVYQTIIAEAKTIFWDGPMGKYEDPRFRPGTLAVAEAMAFNPHTTVLAGGDTAALAEQTGLLFHYSHVSIAGGAALEYLAGKELPGLVALEGV